MEGRFLYDANGGKVVIRGIEEFQNNFIDEIAKTGANAYRMVYSTDAEDGEKYSPEEIEEAVASSTDVIDRIMAYCDHRKYTIAVVTLDTNTVEAMVKSGGIGSAEALLSALKEELNRFRRDSKAKMVQAAWIPSVFQIVAEGFSEKDGTINSMLKQVRHRVVELHGELIEHTCSREGSRTENARNLDALRRLFKLP